MDDDILRQAIRRFASVAARWKKEKAEQKKLRRKLRKWFRATQWSPEQVEQMTHGRQPAQIHAHRHRCPEIQRIAAIPR